MSVATTLRRTQRSAYSDIPEFPPGTRGQMIDGQTYSLTQFAHRADVDVSTVLKWVEQGLPTLMRSGLIWIRVADWYTWISKSGQSPTSVDSSKNP